MNTPIPSTMTSVTTGYESDASFSDDFMEIGGRGTRKWKQNEIAPSSSLNDLREYLSEHKSITVMALFGEIFAEDEEYVLEWDTTSREVVLTWDTNCNLDGETGIHSSDGSGWAGWCSKEKCFKRYNRPMHENEFVMRITSIGAEPVEDMKGQVVYTEDTHGDTPKVGAQTACAADVKDDDGIYFETEPSSSESEPPAVKPPAVKSPAVKSPAGKPKPEARRIPLKNFPKPLRLLIQSIEVVLQVELNTKVFKAASRALRSNTSREVLGAYVTEHLPAMSASEASDSDLPRSISVESNTSTESNTANGPVTASESASTASSKKPRAKKTKKPKKPRAKTAYLFFCSERRPIVKRENPTFKPTEVTKELGRVWKTLTTEQKKPYTKLAADAKEALVAQKALASKEDSPPTETVDQKEDASKEKKPVQKPKRPPSLYILFCKDKRKDVSQANPDLSPKEITKELGRMWREEYKQDLIAMEKYKAQQEEYM